jgi:hypothetical protein
MTAAARTHFWDARQRLFVSGPDRQISWASQAWAAIAGVLPKAESAAALRNAMKHSDAVRPVTPYLYHYVVEGLLRCGLQADALTLIRSYWGGMVQAGADTFWEAYDPDDPLISPYGDRHINSYCHAWSCTPAWLFRAFRLPTVIF